MSKIKKSIKEVTNELRELFEIHSNTDGSRESDGKFYIIKQHYQRGDVINKLIEYFEDKVIDGGYLTVSSITFVYTTFSIVNGTPPAQPTE